MSYTTVYRFQDLNGYESVISKANSDMTYEGFGRILLNPGQTLEYKVTGEEQAIVLQQGDMTCWVEYEGVTVVDGAKGQRGNVYDDLPTALYVPPKATVKLYSEKGMEARVFTAYCEEGNAPYFCPPENIEEGEPGEYIYKRKYRFIFGQPGKHNDHITKLLIVGETVSVPGGWIGFPAHRHDYERPGKECVLDEIFSFQMTSTEDGPGRGGVMQHGYDLTDENKKIWDEVNVIEENNTAVALPTGYHTTVNLEKLNYHAKAFIQVQLEPSQKKEFYPYVDSIPNVIECNCVTGDYSEVMEVVFKTTAALDEFINDIQSRFGKTSTQIVFSTSVEHRGLHLATEDKED